MSKVTASAISAHLSVAEQVAIQENIGLPDSAYNQDNRQFKSTGQSIASGGLVTLPHSFGVEPMGVTLVLQCTTAEANYSVGDRVIVDANSTIATGTRVNTIKMDSSNIYIRYSSNSECFVVGDNTDGTPEILTNANWQLYVKAWY